MQPDKKEFLFPFVRGALWSSTAFSLVLGILVFATVVQLRIHEPTTSPALAQMIERAQEDADNDELKTRIRTFDYLARKAFFTSVWQIRTGGILLAFGIAATILLWKASHALSAGDKIRPVVEKKPWWEEQTRSRAVLAYVGAAVVIVVAVTATLTPEYLAANQKTANAPPSLSSRELRTGWTTFRGPGGNGVAYYEKAPVFWDGESMEGVRWKTAVPREGNSSPIVWDGRVFLTGGDETGRDVYCFSLDNGKLLWRHEVNVPAVGENSKPTIDGETGYAAPTPACDGQRVFALFPTGELVCLDLLGKRVWAKHLGVPDNHYGHSSSLIVHEGLLYVQYDHSEGKLYAHKATTGETVWEVPRHGISWASPICVNNGGRWELIVADNETVTSYDPVTGAVIWSQNCVYGEVGPSPAYAEGMVYVTAEYSPAAAIRTPGSDPGDSSEIIWRWDEDLPTTASPVAGDSLVFFAGSGGTVSCVRADSGTTAWTYTYDKGFYASPVIVGDRVYLMGRDGIMRILAVGETFEEIGSVRLGESSVATPAVLENVLVLRGTKHLYCIDGR